MREHPGFALRMERGVHPKHVHKRPCTSSLGYRGNLGHEVANYGCGEAEPDLRSGWCNVNRHAIGDGFAPGVAKMTSPKRLSEPSVLLDWN
jgi:hypothetical protein